MAALMADSRGVLLPAECERPAGERHQPPEQRTTTTTSITTFPLAGYDPWMEPNLPEKMYLLLQFLHDELMEQRENNRRDCEIEIRWQP
ncbi:unnamed protein product [Heligmosomoides polygyrus]|uniref:Uncharacterized protein n=1 Tax=Heligmosomoides polygyrus TaxID=6339 RepID=A0A183FZ20_HELPZ|nr:unnamed protein product [Heligmosomoides polygyrus]